MVFNSLVIDCSGCNVNLNGLSYETISVNSDQVVLKTNSVLSRNLLVNSDNGYFSFVQSDLGNVTFDSNGATLYLKNTIFKNALIETEFSHIVMENIKFDIMSLTNQLGIVELKLDSNVNYIYNGTARQSPKSQVIEGDLQNSEIAFYGFFKNIDIKYENNSIQTKTQ